MKEKCRTLKISILITLISLIILTICFFLYNKTNNSFYNYIFNISIAIFGSSFVMLFVSKSEYIVAKKSLLEKIWLESNKLNKELYKIKPIVTYIDKEILINYINEWEILQTDLGKLFYKGTPSYDKMCDFLRKFYKDKIKNLSEKDAKEFIDIKINSERKKILKELEKSAKQYSDLYNCSVEQLNLLIGDVQFFTGKKNYNYLFNNIFLPFLNKYNSLKEKICYHCYLYQKKEANNKSALLSIILNNQKELFKIKKIHSKSGVWLNSYDEFCNTMEDSIEKFRANIFYNCEEIKQDHYPISSTYYNKNE